MRGLQRAAADGQLEQVLGETVVLHVGQKGLHALWNATTASVSSQFITKSSLFNLPVFISISPLQTIDLRLSYKLDRRDLHGINAIAITSWC